MNILIVVDMQNDFVSGSLATKEAKAIVPRVVDKINNFDGEVIYTRDTHFDNYLNTSEGKKLPIEHCIKDSFGWEIVSPVKERVGDSKIIDKPSFGSTELPKIVKIINNSGNIDSITLIGLCTDICVLSNALILKAAFPETEIIVDASCCAGTTVQNHNTALNALVPCQVEVINRI
jgi:nicotinamidase-related amidase